MPYTPNNVKVKSCGEKIDVKWHELRFCQSWNKSFSKISLPLLHISSQKNRSSKETNIKIRSDSKMQACKLPVVICKEDNIQVVSCESSNLWIVSCDSASLWVVNCESVINLRLVICVSPQIRQSKSNKVNIVYSNIQ